MPPRTASIVFALASALATIGAAWLLSQALEMNAAALLAALVPLAVLNTSYGETPPFALLALAAAAAVVRRPRLSGFLATLSLVQPNVGFSAVLSIFALWKRARLGVIVAGVLLGALALLAGGFALIKEYLTVVVPLQSQSEVAARDQYGITHTLYVLGLAQPTAQRVGLLLFCIWTVAVILITARAQRRSGLIEAVVLLPAALALLGNLYLHDIQIMLALPGAFFVAGRSRGTARIVCGAACVALSVVWTQHGRIWIALDTLAVLGAFAALVPVSLERHLRFALPGALLLAAIACNASPNRLEPPLAIIRASANDYAAIAWRRYVDEAETGAEPVLPKLPTWLALGVIAAGALLLKPGRDEWRAPRLATASRDAASRRYD